MEIKDMKEFKLPKRRQPFFNFVKKILRIFIKAEVVSHCEQIPEKSIIVTNHSAKMGPMVYELYYPRYHATWGAHPMLGNYKSRFLYLRDVLYIQKLGKKKLPATLKALFEACFSIFFYKGMKIMPTYTDMRFLYTVRNSMEVLDMGASVMIFPEDSAEGYFDELKGAFPGFVMLAEQYFNKTGEDVPIVTAYYHKPSKKIIINPPKSVQKLKAEGMSRNEIAEFFKEEINGIFREHFKEKNSECDKIQTKA